MTTQAATARSNGFDIHLDRPFDEAMSCTRAALKEQGFGVLTEIDVQQTQKEKLGISFRRYVILGACNPPLANRVLEAELDLGLHLPCKVVLYEDGDGTTVTVMDAQAALVFVGGPTSAPLAAEARARLEQGLAALVTATVEQAANDWVV